MTAENYIDTSIPYVTPDYTCSRVLSLMELGFGTAVVYSMYKPLAEDDTPAVCALLKLYRTVYRWIALAMTKESAKLREKSRDWKEN